METNNSLDNGLAPIWCWFITPTIADLLFDKNTIWL